MKLQVISTQQRIKWLLLVSLAACLMYSLGYPGVALPLILLAYIVSEIEAHGWTQVSKLEAMNTEIASVALIIACKQLEPEDDNAGQAMAQEFVYKAGDIVLEKYNRKELK